MLTVRSSKLLFVSLVLNMASAWMWVLEYENSQYLQLWVRENLALSSADLSALFGGVAIGVLGYGGYYFGKRFRLRPRKIHIDGEQPVKARKSRIREL